MVHNTFVEEAGQDTPKWLPAVPGHQGEAQYVWVVRLIYLMLYIYIALSTFGA